jgi:DNA-directed RNA polymerase specialized sigma24 family protein
VTDSVTRHISGLKANQPVAVQALWDRYFAALVRFSRRRLAGAKRREVDEEDVALSAFHSVCARAAAGQFARLEDRHDLWQLLALVAARKATNERKRQARLRRGGGRVRGDSVLVGAANASGIAGFDGLSAAGGRAEDQIMERESLEASLGSLDDDLLRTIAVAKLEGFTSGEIAGRLRVTERTVERKLRLIRERLAGSMPAEPARGNAGTPGR